VSTEAPPRVEDLAPAFEEHRPPLRAVAQRLLGSAAEANDAVQECRPSAGVLAPEHVSAGDRRRRPVPPPTTDWSSGRTCRIPPPSPPRRGVPGLGRGRTGANVTRALRRGRRGGFPSLSRRIPSLTIPTFSSTRCDAPLSGSALAHTRTKLRVRGEGRIEDRPNRLRGQPPVPVPAGHGEAEFPRPMVEVDEQHHAPDHPTVQDDGPVRLPDPIHDHLTGHGLLGLGKVGGRVAPSR
jgi:hypothetical protein